MPKTNEPRLVPAETLERIGAWAGRKPRIALMGEFSSGKSTLLNLLIGEDLLPTRVTATELPPVWFGHGAPRAFWVDRQGGRHELDFGSFGGIPRSARYVRVFTPAPFLERCDIIDTPGISDPNLEDESWRFPVGMANFVLWCTPATQAWRETERSTWLSLPERLRARSVLVVTRADKLAVPGDREKVARRLSRESFGLFGSIVFLSSLEAERGRRARAETGDTGLWLRSGGAELEERIDDGLRSVRAERTDLLDRYRASAAERRRPLVATVTALPGALRPSLPPEPAEEAEPGPLRLLTPLEPVRPRRVELPEARRSERPMTERPMTERPMTERPLTETPADPLGEIRAGWKALRTPEEEERGEPATILRLTDPVAASEDRAEEVPLPLILEDAAPPEAAEPLAAHWAEPEEEEALGPEPVAEAPAAPAAEDPAEAAAFDALLAHVQAATEEAPLPRAVRIWRDIVARTPEIPSNSPVLAMIDQLLCELSREDEQRAGTVSGLGTITERNQAA